MSNTGVISLSVCHEELDKVLFVNVPSNITTDNLLEIVRKCLCLPCGGFVLEGDDDLTIHPVNSKRRKLDSRFEIRHIESEGEAMPLPHVYSTSLKTAQFDNIHEKNRLKVKYLPEETGNSTEFYTVSGSKSPDDINTDPSDFQLQTTFGDDQCSDSNAQQPVMYGPFEDNAQYNGFSAQSNQQLAITSGPSSVSHRTTGFVGLVNSGMTCYMNSLLQTLFMTPEFRNALYRWRFDGSESDAVSSIPYQLQRLFVQLQTSTNAAVSTHGVTRSFGWCTADIIQQQDIHELCRVLFDALEKKLTCPDQSKSSDTLSVHQEVQQQQQEQELGQDSKMEENESYKDSSQSSNSPSSTDNLINRLYQGERADYVRCLSCSRISWRPDTFLDVQVPLRPFELDAKPYDNLEVALQALLKPERLDGSNQYWCSNCESKQDADRGCVFRKMPYLLSLQLMRFTFDPNTLNKIKLNDRFPFPLQLDLTDYVTDSDGEPLPPCMQSPNNTNVVSSPTTPTSKSITSASQDDHHHHHATCDQDPMIVHGSSYLRNNVMSTNNNDIHHNNSSGSNSSSNSNITSTACCSNSRTCTLVSSMDTDTLKLSSNMEIDNIDSGVNSNVDSPCDGVSSSSPTIDSLNVRIETVQDMNELDLDASMNNNTVTNYSMLPSDSRMLLAQKQDDSRLVTDSNTYNMHATTTTSSAVSGTKFTSSAATTKSNASATHMASGDGNEQDLKSDSDADDGIASECTCSSCSSRSHCTNNINKMIVEDENKKKKKSDCLSSNSSRGGSSNNEHCSNSKSITAQCSSSDSNVNMMTKHNRRHRSLSPFCSKTTADRLELCGIMGSTGNLVNLNEIDTSGDKNARKMDCTDWSNTETNVIGPNNNNNDKNGSLVYELFSVMVHSGSINGGHYYAYIKSLTNDKWYKFNDQFVMEVKEDCLESTFGPSTTTHSYMSASNAYFLMYRRIDRKVNENFMCKNEFPEHIQKMINEIQEEEASIARQREKEMKACRFDVCTRSPIDQNIIHSTTILYSDQTLTEAAKTVIKALLPNFDCLLEPPRNCRLVHFLHRNNTIGKSAEFVLKSNSSNAKNSNSPNLTSNLYPDDSVTVGELLDNRHMYQFSLWLEHNLNVPGCLKKTATTGEQLRAPSPSIAWRMYEPQGFTFHIHRVDLPKNNMIHAPQLLWMPLSATINCLLHEIANLYFPEMDSELIEIQLMVDLTSANWQIDLNTDYVQRQRECLKLPDWALLLYTNVSQPTSSAVALDQILPNRHDWLSRILRSPVSSFDGSVTIYADLRLREGDATGVHSQQQHIVNNNNNNNMFVNSLPNKNATAPKGLAMLTTSTSTDYPNESVRLISHRLNHICKLVDRYLYLINLKVVNLPSKNEIMQLQSQRKLLKGLFEQSAPAASVHHSSSTSAGTEFDNNNNNDNDFPIENSEIPSASNLKTSDNYQFHSDFVYSPQGDCTTELETLHLSQINNNNDGGDGDGDAKDSDDFISTFVTYLTNDHPIRDNFKPDCLFSVLDDIDESGGGAGGDANSDVNGTDEHLAMRPYQQHPQQQQQHYFGTKQQQSNSSFTRSLSVRVDTRLDLNQFKTNLAQYLHIDLKLVDIGLQHAGGYVTIQKLLHLKTNDELICSLVPHINPGEVSVLFNILDLDRLGSDHKLAGLELDESGSDVSPPNQHLCPIWSQPLELILPSGISVSQILQSASYVIRNKFNLQISPEKLRLRKCTLPDITPGPFYENTDQLSTFVNQHQGLMIQLLSNPETTQFVTIQSSHPSTYSAVSESGPSSATTNNSFTASLFLRQWHSATLSFDPKWHEIVFPNQINGVHARWPIVKQWLLNYTQLSLDSLQLIEYEFPGVVHSLNLVSNSPVTNSASSSSSRSFNKYGSKKPSQLQWIPCSTIGVNESMPIWLHSGYVIFFRNSSEALKKINANEALQIDGREKQRLGMLLNPWITRDISSNSAWHIAHATWSPHNSDSESELPSEACCPDEPGLVNQHQPPSASSALSHVPSCTTGLDNRSTVSYFHKREQPLKIYTAEDLPRSNPNGVINNNNNSNKQSVMMGPENQCISGGSTRQSCTRPCSPDLAAHSERESRTP